MIFDVKRNTYNVVDGRLFPNTTEAEATNNDMLDIVSNGFKLRSSDDAFNGSSSTNIYYAVAESPFKTANAR